MRLLIVSLAAGLSSIAVLAADAPTFHKDLLPVLQKHCQSCHRPGEATPMSLLTYETTRPWARAMKNAVASGKMPPWHADPNYGHFLNDRRMPEADKQTLIAWVDGGAVEGDPKDTPAPLQFTEGWNIKPDVIVEMVKPYAVPATGVVNWLDFVMPVPFKEDTWVIAGEVRPGDRSVVHHASVSFIPPGPVSAQLAALATGNPVPLPRGIENNNFVGFAPGRVHGRFDVEDSAVLIPAGSYLVLNMHYTPTGKATTDRTKIGLELAKTPPKNQFVSIGRGGEGVSPMSLSIKPGDANAPGHRSLTFSKAVKLAYLNPHMHLRGKDFKATAHYPTGESQILLNVPRYDYNWQTGYYLEKPLLLPAGTRLDLDGHWDNSPNNPSNPDPTATVRWGQQAWDEMFGGGVHIIIPREVDPKSVLDGPGGN